MKKDLGWLKEEASAVLRGVFNNHALDYVKYIEVKRQLERLFDQLDEPEVLSQEWIDAHKKHGIVSSGIFGDSGLLRDYVLVKDLEKETLLVPKQELPVIPKFVADYIDDRKEVGFPIYQAIRIVREDSRFEHSHLREWLWTNKGQETFVRAWLDGYTVEEEHKYYVLDAEDIPLLEIANNQTCKTTTGLSIYEDGRDNSGFELTEQEIKDYDERYWPFAVKIEELEE